MANCPKCGSQVSESAKFCGACGEKLERDDIASTAEHSSSHNAYVEDTTFKEMFFKTTGRLNRLRFFKRNLVVVLINLIPQVMTFLVMAFAPAYVYEFAALTAIIYFMTLPMYYFLMVRRLHDMNRDNKIAIALIVFTVVVAMTQQETTQIGSDGIGEIITAVMMLVITIPFFIMALYITFKDGTHGENDYGADPLNR